MPHPDRHLTPAQHEIMEIVWNHGRGGATVAEIWQAVAQTRDVARTTVLNLVDRLEKRGWLKRHQRQGAYRYVAAIGRNKTAALLAGDFVDDFFGGSAGELVMSLLGSKKLNRKDIEQLQRLLSAREENKPEGEQS